jgi:hypothetical protein
MKTKSKNKQLVESGEDVGKHKRPEGATRSYSIYIEEYPPPDEADQYVEPQNRFREWRKMDCVGPPEPEELHAFLRRAVDRFIRKWVKEKRDQLTKFERRGL